MVRKTKIVATLGPATCTEPQIRALLAEGMNIVRLNGSHNTLPWHRGVIRCVRRVAPLLPILLDIPGRKVRTGVLVRDVPLRKGETLVFTTDGGTPLGARIPVTYGGLHQNLRPGNIVLADDGTLKFQVVEVCGYDIICLIQNDGILRNSKGLNIPYVRLNGPVVSDRDREMLAFARAEGVDFIGVSFVESAAHVAEVRQLLAGRSPLQIIAKIENTFGLENLREIIVASDGLMIDRGDLTAETEIESLAIMQRRILREAQMHGKPVIVATEMLHTMIHSPHATKAEVNDISTAVRDGASAVMLSGETAIGEFPAEAIALMSRVSKAVENADEPAGSRPAPFLWAAPSFNGVQDRVGRCAVPSQESDSGATWSHSQAPSVVPKEEAIPSAIGGAINELCRQLPVTKVVCLTASGFAPKMISKYRLRQPVLAVTNSVEVARQLSMSWGVQALVLDLKFSRRSADHIIRTLKQLYDLRILSEDDFIIVTAVKYPKTGNRMNTIEIYEVRDLVESQGWSREIGVPAAAGGGAYEG